MKNIILTGFMASGKTVVGKELANLTGYTFIDTDELIENETKKTINKIFEEFGEDYFRGLETEISKKVSTMQNCIVSTGGGLVLRKENLDYLKINGIIFNLSPSFDIIKNRLETARLTRPLLQNQNYDEIQKRFNERKPFYDECDYKIDILDNRTPLQTANQIFDIYINL